MSDDLSTFEFENFQPEEWQRRVFESDAPLVFDSLALRLATRRHAREMCDVFDALLRDEPLM